MTTCLILAAGNSERHNGGNKPLLKVNGETLLSRTFRLLDFPNQRLWIITHREEIWDQFKGWCWNPNARRWVVETLLSARHLWSENGSTVIALGDVFYTENAVNEMLNEQCKCAAFGKGCNIHALRWNSRHHGRIEKALSKSVEHAEKHPASYGAGKLWTWISSFEPPMPVIDFGDETTDFDSPLEHKRFIEKYASHR